MKTTYKLIIAIAVFTFFIACKKHHDQPVTPTPVSYDTDAQKFFDASGLIDTTQKSAVNNLVKQLKDSALWTKFVAIYPMVGGTAATAKWNLKDARDMDVAYRLTFSGSPVFAKTGVLFPTVADYADTHLADTSIGGYNNASMAYYSRTQNAISGYDMGCTDGAVPYNELSINFVDGDDSEWFGLSEEDILTPNTTGLFMFSSTSSDVKRYRNGVIVAAKGAAPNNAYTNLTILLGKSRVTIHPGQKECAFASIGNGLSDAQAVTLSNIIQNFQTKLAR